MKVTTEKLRRGETVIGSVTKFDHDGFVLESRTYDARPCVVTDEIKRRCEVHDQLVAALKDVTDTLDAFGGMPDGEPDHKAWVESRADAKIIAARAALTAAGQ